MNLRQALCIDVSRYSNPQVLLLDIGKLEPILCLPSIRIGAEQCLRDVASSFAIRQQDDALLRAQELGYEEVLVLTEAVLQYGVHDVRGKIIRGTRNTWNMFALFREGPPQNK